MLSGIAVCITPSIIFCQCLSVVRWQLRVKQNTFRQIHDFDLCPKFLANKLPCCASTQSTKAFTLGRISCLGISVYNSSFHRKAYRYIYFIQIKIWRRLNFLLSTHSATVYFCALSIFIKIVPYSSLNDCHW